MMNWAEQVKETRRRLGMNQSEFASLLGAHFITVSRWEIGTSVPDSYRAAFISRFWLATEKDPLCGATAKTKLVTNGALAALHYLFIIAD